jgi:hypothetical protein
MSDPLRDLLDEQAAIRAEATVVELRAAGIRKRQSAVLDKIRAICPHETTKETSSYYSGSYYDKASTTYQVHCTVCGLKVDEHTVSHCYYG